MARSKHTIVCRPAGIGVLSFLSGAGVWFGVQAFSGRDNFSDQINPFYFVILFAAAFVLGLVTRYPVVVGAVLLLSQLVCYLIYPNINWTLGNLFPIAAGLLAVFVVPALLFAYVGSRLRSATRSRENR